ncbi:response regulator [Terrabacter sp. 2TAF16]|jgi:two-component system response regulator DesR|uniref:response regulator n=1 Tax=Terrabacter sp. 2TAF16 TaxID=3233008 RepID=UPI003F96C445
MSVTLGVGPGVGVLEDYVRVLVVDDHQAVASAMALAIGLQAGLECIGSANCASEARASVAALRPDVIVMDVNLGDGDGIELAAELIREDPRLRVVVLTADVDQTLLRRAADAGASALLLKDGTLTELFEALRGCKGDGFVVHPRVLRDLLRCPPVSNHTPLTVRETEVLMHLSEGHNVATISGRLGITRLTCRGYVKNIMVKLNAHSQLEAVVTARRFGLIGS